MNFILKLHVFPFEIMVSVDESDKSLSDRLIRYGNTPESFSCLMNLANTVQGRCAMLYPSNHIIIRLFHLKDKVKMRSIIIHESLHATSFLLHAVGVSFQLETSDEIYAYLQQYICEQIFTKLKL